MTMLRRVKHFGVKHSWIVVDQGRHDHSHDDSPITPRVSNEVHLHHTFVYGVPTPFCIVIVLDQPY